ncbi:MAG TPA: phosphate ABC transporter permease PstA [Acidimicrobiales bacterium]|nr:phosphate ABC transporter permease PstA [Acidimicrobiales bacterium]
METSTLANPRRRRVWVNRVAMAGLALGAVIALIPLVGVLAYTVGKGLSSINGDFLTTTMRGVGPLDTTGGIYHSIVGTIEQVLIASAIAVPLGIIAAVYVVEYGHGRLAGAVRFLIDVMTGIPSIVAGLFIFAFWVLALHRGFSGFAAGMALAVLMLPVVARASEEMLKLVPDELREASYALGVPKWRTVLSVVLPVASAGITTGVVLAVARVTGETAPLLLTAFGFDSVNYNPFSGPQSALPLFVYQQATSAFKVAVDRAWGAALVLILFVVVLSVIARLLTRRNRLV